MCFLGLMVPAVALVLLGSSGAEDTNKAIALLVIAVGVNSAIFCGFNVNHMDISPNHASTLMGITNGTSNICGIVAPLLVQFLVTDEVSIYDNSCLLLCVSRDKFWMNTGLAGNPKVTLPLPLSTIAVDTYF